MLVASCLPCGDEEGCFSEYSALGDPSYNGSLSLPSLTAIMVQPSPLHTCSPSAIDTVQ